MEDSYEREFNPKGKGYLLGSHILQKGFQGGSLVALLAVAPLVVYRSTRDASLSRMDVLTRVLRACGSSALVGTALAGTGQPPVRKLP
jgi:hypothetical protein